MTSVNAHSSLALAIDARPAQQGAAQFTAAIEAIKKAVQGLERDTNGAFTSLRKADASGLREIIRESQNAATAQTQIASASDRAAQQIQRTALAAAASLRTSENATQRLILRLQDVGDTAGIDAANKRLEVLRRNLIAAATPLDVRQARSDFATPHDAANRSAIAAQESAWATKQAAQADGEAARATAAYAAQLEALALKYNPLKAQSLAYAAALDEIAFAEREGAISAAIATQARERAAQVHLAGAAAADQHAAAIKRNATDTMQGVMAGQQLFDVLIMAQGGFQSVGVIAMQQGSQLAAQAQTIKASGGSVFKTLLGGFTSLINPMSLVVIGGTAVVAMLAQMAFASAASAADTRTLSERLSELESSVNSYATATQTAGLSTRELAAEYGSAATSVREFLSALQEAAQYDAMAEVRASISGLKSEFLELREYATGNFLEAPVAMLALKDSAVAAGDATGRVREALVKLATADGIQAQYDSALALIRVMDDLKAKNGSLTSEQQKLYSAVARIGGELGQMIGITGQNTAATEAWKSSMAGVLGYVNSIMGALSSLGGGIITNAGKAVELAALNSGQSIYDSEVARRRWEFEKQAEADQMAADSRGAGWGLIQRGITAGSRFQMEEGLRLDREIAAKRRAIQEAEQKGGGGGGARVEALGDESRQLAKVSKQLNDRIFEIGRENQALQLLASGQAQTREGAEAMALAMELGGGNMDAATASTIRLYEEQVKLNEQLQREAANPLQDYLDSLPSAVEATKQLRATLAESVTDGLTDAFMGDFDAKKIVDSLRRSLAQSLAQQTTKMLFGGLFQQDESGVKAGATAGAAIMTTGIVSASAQGAAMYAAAIKGASIPLGGGNGGGGFLGGLLSIFGFSEGGYSDRPGITSHAVSPAVFRNAPQFAQGTANTSGIPAILHPNEAVVPLTKGRKIPVDASGLETGGGGNVSVSQTFAGGIHVTVESSGSITDPAEAGRAAERIAELVKLKVQEQLAEQAAYGGMMNPRGV